MQPGFICVRKKSLAGPVPALLRTAALWWGHAGCMGNNAIPERRSSRAHFSVPTATYVSQRQPPQSSVVIFLLPQFKKKTEPAQLQFSKSFIFNRLRRSWQTQKRTMTAQRTAIFTATQRETIKSFTFNRSVSSGGVPKVSPSSRMQKERVQHRPLRPHLRE